jgi:hypothetical protein
MLLNLVITVNCRFQIRKRLFFGHGHKSLRFVMW